MKVKQNKPADFTIDSQRQSMIDKRLRMANVNLRMNENQFNSNLDSTVILNFFGGDLIYWNINKNMYNSYRKFA